MESIIVILLIAIFALIVIENRDLKDKVSDIDRRISDLQEQLLQREKQSKPIEPQQSVAKPPPSIEAKPAESAKPESLKPLKPELIPLVERQKEVIYDSMTHIRRPVKKVEPVPKPAYEPKPSFFERYPDLEKFIGENLVNKIGIAILVLAIGFFVKYAIDNNWIGPGGRVAVGILCGTILIALAHRFRNGFKAFSSVLAGGGLAVFYFTITLAFQEFHLFTQLIALCILIVITIFATILSLLYDKQELAVIALAGGFASPFLVSNGTANYNGLLLYLLILNTGLLVIAYFKAWRILNISSFVLAVIVIAAILFSLPAPQYLTGFVYVTLFYLLFFAVHVINNIRENKKFIAIDFTVLLINTALYFATGLYILSAMNLGNLRGLFSAGLAALNLVLSFMLFHNRKVDPAVLYLLIGITLTFISLTAPLQLHGHYITLFWSAEAVLLYWLYQKSAIKLMKAAALLIWLAMVLSLTMDLDRVYSESTNYITIIANRGFITMLFSSLCTYLLYLLVKTDDIKDIYGVNICEAFFKISAFILLFVSGLLEINHQFCYYYPQSDINILYLMLYVPVFVYSVDLGKNILKISQIAAVILIAIAIGFYLLLTPVYFRQLSTMPSPKGLPLSDFDVHWISDIILLLLFYRLINVYKVYYRQLSKALVWIISAAIISFFSAELCLLIETIFSNTRTTVYHIQIVYVKTGLPILWGMCSFALMWLGMHNKQKTLRIISLTLFSITLVKLFLYDITNIPVAGKIAAFFCLGILLLIVSFMYQKVKKIISEDEKAEME